MIHVNVVKTGSKGNAVILNDSILIDCGVAWKLLEPYAAGLRLVLLTHSHGDHFNPATVKRLAKERPTLRFGCCEWMAGLLLNCGVEKRQADVYAVNRGYHYDSFGLCPVPLVHDKPNCGYILEYADGGGTVFYATDTANLDGISAPNCDLYLIEANYGSAEIAGRIRAKEAVGAYAYEWKAIGNHLSREAAEEWLARNAGEGSSVIYLHEHGGG